MPALSKESTSSGPWVSSEALAHAAPHAIGRARAAQMHPAPGWGGVLWAGLRGSRIWLLAEVGQECARVSVPASPLEPWSAVSGVCVPVGKRSVGAGRIRGWACCVALGLCLIFSEPWVQRLKGRAAPRPPPRRPRWAGVIEVACAPSFRGVSLPLSECSAAFQTKIGRAHV